MELDSFIRNVVRRWYVVVLLLAIAITGTWLYHAQTKSAKATAIVTVIRPYSPAPGEYIPPQITFEALDENRDLAVRVANALKDGSLPADLQGKISVDIKVSTKPTLTPLYEVTFEDRDPKRALAVSNVVVAEAIKMYYEINQPTDRGVREAFAPELERLQGEAAAARAELQAFESDNNAFNLPSKRDQVRGYVQQLSLLQLQLSSGGGSAGAVLTAAQTELTRLTGLEGEYTRLKTELDLSQSEVFRLEARVTELSLQAPAGTSVAAFLSTAQTQLESARSRFNAAQTALTDFRQQNNVSDVTGSRQSQLALVNQLGLSTATNSSSAGSISAELATQQAELRRLEDLEPRFSEISLRLQRAETQLSGVQQRTLDIVGGQTLPAQTSVSIFDNAKLQSNLFWNIVTYGLAVIVALFLAFTIIYLLSVFERFPPSPSLIEARLGVPVLAHVPAARTEDDRWQ